jgi:hypothetical protein
MDIKKIAIAVGKMIFKVSKVKGTLGRANFGREANPPANVALGAISAKILIGKEKIVDTTVDKPIAIKVAGTFLVTIGANLIKTADKVLIKSAG